jgi:hypothetical protein
MPGEFFFIPRCRSIDEKAFEARTDAEQHAFSQELATAQKEGRTPRSLEDVVAEIRNKD